MTNNERRMTNAPPDAALATRTARHWSRWLLAVWEMFLMLWFQVVCVMVILFMLKHPEIFGVDGKKAIAQTPLLTQVVREVLFENEIGLMILVLGIGLGFGAASLNSTESITSRIFRWMMVGLVTLVWVALAPVHDQVTTIGGGDDTAPGSIVWTAVLCAAGVLASVLGIRSARRCA
jgi:hypothetical protein